MEIPREYFRGILPTAIFPRYISRELQWKKIKTKQKKNNDVSFLPTELQWEKIKTKQKKIMT
jgi:hypothetical protein